MFMAGNLRLRALAWFLPMLVAAPVMGQIRITEFMYDGTNGEFVELTNRGAVSVDLTGWTYDDDGVTAGTLSLTDFGMVAPGETVVIAQSADAATFRAAWGLPVTVKVVPYGALAGQLQRNDTIRIFDESAVLHTQLAYGDQTFPGTIRTQNKGSWPCAEALGSSPITTAWILAAVADAQGSFTSVSAEIGSPGTYVHSFCGPPPTGACCTSGNCTDSVTEVDCGSGGGLYQGDASTCGSVSCPIPSGGAMRITEYMYSGTGLEFIEFTNLDNHPIDMAGWSYDDDSAIPGTVSLSAFGVVATGESVILAEATDAAFIADWGLSGVTVIGGLTTNLGRNDQINLFDNGGALVDRLSFGDQTFPGTIRAQNASGWPCQDGIGTNMISKWYLSRVPDVQNSYASNNADVGNPGTFQVISCQFCGNGVVDGSEECDGGVCCTSNCTFVTAGTECRASAGVCDVAEACDGSSSACPADLFDLGTPCRPSAGDCDVAESCTGTGPTCPSDTFQPNGFVCRSAAGICDDPETCDGLSAVCPSDGFNTGATCRSSAGACDPAETCNGSGIDCPIDVLDVSTVCRPVAGDCDVEETCGSAGPACPTDVLLSGNVCRPVGGDCDVEEFCGGSSPTCPADAFDTGTICRASAGDCDIAEACDGSGADCPADAVEPDTTECRASAGDCDVAENCDGAGVDCPADALQSGTVCRPVAGPCDLEEVCSGADANCPADGFDSGMVCRESADPCDPEEVCDGTGADCPADGGGLETCVHNDGCCPTNCLAADDNDCTSIPTVSEWGLATLALLLLIGAKLQFGRRTETVA